MVNGVWLRPGLSARGNVTGITKKKIKMNKTNALIYIKFVQKSPS